MDYKKKYEDAIENIKKIKTANKDNKKLVDFIEYKYPELKEYEGDMFRQYLLSCCNDAIEKGRGFELSKSTTKQLKTWLEKQGEMKFDINDDILLRFAFYQYNDYTLYLSSVFVEECNRKRGYGSKILKAAVEVAKTFGISKIRLKVETNSWMEEWYKRNGYEYLTSEGKYNWFEKQIEQKTADNFEPKFKVGDYIINKHGFIMHIDGIDDNMYVYRVLDDNRLLKYDITKTDKSCHLWTIRDAKDGDVLTASDNSIFIFKEIEDYGCKYYIALEKDNETINVNDNLEYFLESIRSVKPSTKKQSDLLFAKMKEAGYKWDADKKELKKIEQKFEWSEEDDTFLHCLEYTIKHYYDNKDTINKCCSWLKSIKERIKG